MKLDLDALKQQTKQQQEKATSSGGVNYQDLKERTTGVVLLPYKTSEGKEGFIKEYDVHQIWSQAQKKFIVNVGSPANVGEEDPITKMGWKYYEKYQDSDNKKLKDLFKNFMTKTVRCVNVINVKKVDDGVKVLNIPQSVFDYISEKIMDCETEDDLKKICDYDKGRVLKIKHNGKERLDKKYTMIEFGEKPVRLVESGKFDEETLDVMLYNLDKLEPACDSKTVNEALKRILKYVRKIEEQETESIVDEDEMNDDLDEQMVDENADDDSDEFDLD